MNVDDFKELIEARSEAGRNPQGISSSEEILSKLNDGNGAGLLPARRIKFSATIGDPVDRSVISYPAYNSFNYSIFLKKDQGPMKLSLGVTSPGFGEGKTTVICNLATALSMGSGKKTVVVDLNLANPRIHEVFGTSRGPGLAEALAGSEICVAPTQLDNVFALPVGNTRIVPPSNLPVFREVLETLFREFEFVLVDLPPTGSKAFPTLIANQLSALLVVIRSRVTKRRDVKRLFRRIREEKVLGFIMNGVNELDL